MLGAIIERLDKTEIKLESMERKINTPSSFTSGSGIDNRRKVPTVVRVSFLNYTSWGYMHIKKKRYMKGLYYIGACMQDFNSIFLR